MDLMEVMRFDSNLSLGDTVEVRWTNCGYSHRAAGTVTKLNACSVRVALTEGQGNYPVGAVIAVTRCTFRSIERWSWRNGVFPVVRCPGCGVQCVHRDVEHLNDCDYQGRNAREFPYEVSA